MRFKGFIGPSYTLQSVDADCQRLINLYPEMNEMGTENEGEVASLVSTPGLRLLTTLTGGPVRGEFTDSTGNLWAVSGNTLYQISSSWVVTVVGQLNTSDGPVSFKDNGTDGVVVDGPYGYTWKLASTNTPSTALNVSSTPIQVFNGTVNQLLILPDVSTLAVNDVFVIQNLGTSIISVQTFDGSPIQAMNQNSMLVLTCVAISGNGTAPWSSNYITTSTSTVTDSLITTLTSTSQALQVFTGVNTQTVVLPDPSTLTAGQEFVIQNQSSGALDVQTSLLVDYQTVQPQSTLVLTCTSPSGTGASAWKATSLSTSTTNTTPAGTTSTYSRIIDANFQGATQVEFMDGYFIFIKPNSNQFYLSPINAVTPISGLDIGSKESYPDNIVGQIVTQETLYLFGSNEVEAWYDSGSNNFPFSRVQGGVTEIGCAAAFSIEKIGNVIYWLGCDKNGRGIVYRMQGFQPQRISTFTIESEINGFGDLSGSRAWVYQQSGHSFYCLNIPGAPTTWVFDATNQLWHERASLVNGQYARHLADCHALAYDTNVVGDYSSGNLYAIDETVFSDNGQTIVRERTAPHLSKDTERIFHSRFILDMERGTGSDGAGQGSDPKAMLQWSNDAGHSWSNEHWASVGKIGCRLPRVIWRRLGFARDRVYRVRISDPVKITLLGAEIDLDEGAA